MNLYEINALMESLVDEETGELVEFELFQALQMERDVKIENLLRWYKNESTIAAAFKAESDNLSKLARASANKAARLKDYISQVLDGTPFVCPSGKISFRNSPGAVVIGEGVELDEKWISTTILRDPDKPAIRAALKAGEVIPGVTLESSVSTIIK